MNKPIVIYHANCPDGYGAAFAAWLKLGDDAEYLPMQYGTVTDDEAGWDKLSKLIANHDRDIYVLDFSLPKTLMTHLMECVAACNHKVVWLDHHATAFRDWCDGYEKGDRFVAGPLPNGTLVVLNDNKSGAMLAWEFFHPGEEIPMFVRHIDDYDRWQFKLEGTKAFNKALWSLAPWKFEDWKARFIADGSTPHDKAFTVMIQQRMYDEGAAILRAHDQNVQSVVKGAARKCMIECEYNVAVIKGTPFADSLPGPCLLPGLAANCPPHLSSDVGHELANQSGTFGLLWYINKYGKCLCSLRSNGDYDVSAIAKVFGGGGHRNAAGFEVDVQTLLGWLK